MGTEDQLVLALESKLTLAEDQKETVIIDIGGKQLKCDKFLLMKQCNFFEALFAIKQNILESVCSG